MTEPEILEPEEDLGAMLPAPVEETDTPLLLTEAMLKRAEAAIPLINRMKLVALGVTTPQDWTRIGKEPYLTENGVQKVARLFGIRMQVLKVEQRTDTIEGKQIITFTAVVRAKLGSGYVDSEGVANSEDQFFGGGKSLGEISLVNLRKKAVTNACGRALKRVIGLGKVTWKDLEPYKITPETVAGYDFKGKAGSGEAGEPPPPRGPQQPSEAHDKLRSMLMEMAGGKSAEASKLLEKYSAFQGRDGKLVPGKKRIDQLSPAAAGMACRKVEADFGAWKARHGASEPEADREPGEDDNELS